ncbi:MAG TPA: 7TM diverse intracellular signaling domain-containing protein [Spirochaetota bacterium]|nr:7TM diverse intracellular signaling domain-containing protein [Spirochaetota bacterium]
MIVNLKYIKKVFAIILASFIAIFLSTSQAESDTRVLEIQKNMPGIQLEKYTAYYEDMRGDLSITGVTSLPDSAFTVPDYDKTNFGYTHTILWFKLEVNNSSNSPTEWLIESGYPLLDYVTIYIPDNGSYRAVQAGDRLSFSNMPGGFHHFTCLSSAPPGKSTYFIKIQSQGSVVVLLKGWDFPSFIHHFIYYNGFLWIFYGIMIALCIYNSFIYISSRDRIYLYLSCFIFCITLLDLIHNGLTKKFLWPESPFWGNYSHPFMMFLSMVALLKFTQHFMYTRDNLPTAHRILNMFAVFSGVAAFAIFIFPYNMATTLSVFTSFITLFIILFSAIIPMMIKNRKLAIYYSLSCLFFLVGVFFISLRSFGLIGESILASNGYQIGLAAGNILLSIGIADKLNTLRKENLRAMASLSESEERYRLFFERAHDAIMFFINDMPVYANSNMIKISGYSEEEFYVKSVRELFIVDGSTGINVNSIITDLQNGVLTNTQFEAALTNRHGRRMDIIISLSALNTGSSRGIFTILTDITSVKNSSRIIEEQYGRIQSQVSKLETLNRELLEAQTIIVNANIEIEKEKEYLSATLASIGDGVISYDTEGKVFLMNRVAEVMTGLNSDEAMGRNIRGVLRLINDSSDDMFFSAIGNVSDKYNISDIGVPFRMHDKNGEERLVEVTSSMIKLNNKPLGIVMALRDITLKSKIDTEIIKMSKLETIGVLAGGIAHDFNNLLTGISGNISIAKKVAGSDHTLSEIILDIEKAVKRSSALTKQLLTFARGGDPLKVPASLRDIVHESVKFIVKDPSVKCIIRIPDDLRDVLIDPNQINQSLNNLLINAIQAMPGGGEITISAENLSEIPSDLELDPGEYVCLDISDTGCGIPPESLNRIFDPFFTSKSSGTGLGLTSTYSIIKKHRGIINVYSELNRGTTFKIYLLAADEPAETAAHVKKKKFKSSGGSILIMDDEEYILDVFTKMLGYQGYSVECVKTGEEAIIKYREHYESGKHFDFVILDLTIYGGMGGREAIEILRAINPGIKAIVSSGYSENPVMANFREYGFSGVLTKPYSIDDILKVLS